MGGDGSVLDDELRWDRRFDRLIVVVPYVILAAAAVFALAQPTVTWHDRVVMLALTAAAVVWLWVGFPSVTVAAARPWWLRVVYFAGLIALETALVLRSEFYVVFLATAFMQAFLVLPTTAAFAVALVSSLVIYTLPGGLPPLRFTTVSLWLFLVAFQTFATGGFAYVSARRGALREQRRRLLGELEATLHRVAAEALASAAKHAAANRVGITLSYMDDVVVLDIRDDGTGFAAEQTLADGYPGGGHGYGLTSMRRRCGRVAGTLGVESAPGEGTTVTATVPAIPLTEQRPA